VTRNATAELQHGRRGGGWLPAAPPAEKAHVLHVLCKGGPHDGTTLAMHHYGPVAVAPKLVPVNVAHGRYRLGTENRPAPGGPTSVYRWETDPHG
jgi:hypothetical protein